MIRPPRDIDILFILPNSVWQRFKQRPGNRQSQILQEVKGILSSTYNSTNMRGDGQVVVVPFASYAVEVVPAFRQPNGQFLICDTNKGGRYKTIDPTAEIGLISKSNIETSGKMRDLIRILKRWQAFCNVPMKSFLLELLAIGFLLEWRHRGEGIAYYDWMVRDCFEFMIGQAKGLIPGLIPEFILVLGTNEIIFLDNTWQSKAESAYSRSVKACNYDSDGRQNNANDEWEKIFGPDIKLL
jgi:hypothetical protein